ncbi:hypothetical protein JTB14_017668 [Gonioctena quinquepunctata]|nr:hypothetical protein JTB14_017668 [Gonioctena quinquepunctata]
MTTEELEIEHINKKDFIPYATIAQAVHDATYKYWIDKLTEKYKHEMEEYKVKTHVLTESAKEEETLPPKINGAKITQVNKESGKLLNKRKEQQKVNVEVHNRYDALVSSDRSNHETDKE